MAITNAAFNFYYYIIKICRDNRTLYKIGEAKTATRAQQLVEKYTVNRHVSAELLFKEELPHTNKKRLNDKTIHSHLTELERVDPYLFRGLVGEDDGSTEAFFARNKTDEELIAYVKSIVDVLGADIRNFTVNYHAANVRFISDTKDRLHIVQNELVDVIENKFGSPIHTLQDKTILLIGQFDPSWVATFALYNNIYIMHDSSEQIHMYGYLPLNNKIKYISETKELFDMGLDFDLILANPPYKQGNEITNNIVNNVSFDTYINLMPLSCYKGKKLYQHVREFELVDPKLFEDAAITDNLNIAVLTDHESDVEWDEFEMQSFDQRFIEFYRLNAHLPANYECIRAPETLDNICIDTDFYVSVRTAQDGVHKLDENAFDISWNWHNEYNEPHYSKYDKAYWCSFYKYTTSAEKRNLCRFWYKNPLMNELIKGMHKTGGSINPAIPKINWSIERDYEHLTYEQLLEIMRNGVERI